MAETPDALKPFLVVAAYPVLEGARILTQPSPALYGDEALIGVAARRAASFVQTLGPYSRDGFHHPGPALFYLLAPFSSSSRALYLGALAINLVALVGVVAVVHRRVSRSAAMWAAAVLDVFMLGLGIGTFREPWNPYLVILPMMLFLTLWAADEWVWALVVGSFCVQTHLSTTPVVVVLLLWSVRRGWRLAAADYIGLAVFVAMWVPPLVEFHNLESIWQFFAVRHSPVGLIGLGVISAVALISPAPVAFRRRLFVGGLALGSIGGVSLLFADGPVQRYFLLWLGVAPTGLVLAWAMRRSRFSVLPAVASAVAVAVVALAAGPMDRDAGAGPWPAADAEAHQRTVSDAAVFDRAALAAVGALRRPSQVTLSLSAQGLWPYAAGLVWTLEDHGIATAVPGWPLYFPSDGPASGGGAGIRLGLYPANSTYRGAVIADVDGTVLVRQSP